MSSAAASSFACQGTPSRIIHRFHIAAYYYGIVHHLQSQVSLFLPIVSRQAAAAAAPADHGASTAAQPQVCYFQFRRRKSVPSCVFVRIFAQTVFWMTNGAFRGHSVTCIKVVAFDYLAVDILSGFRAQVHRVIRAQVHG